MSGLLGEALRDLAQRHGIGAPAVERCDVAKDGALVLEVEHDGARRWWRFDGALDELTLAREDAVPLARRLDALADGEPVRVLAWRPGRRLTVAIGDGERRRVVKGMRRGRAVAAAAAHARITAALVGRDIGLDVPELTVLDERTSAVQLGWLPAPPARIRAHAEETWRHVGAALACLHELVPVAGLARHGAAEELAVLDRMAERTARALGALPAGWTDARRRLGDALPEPETWVFVHGDLHDGQLLAGGGRLGLLDLDGVVAGSPVQDVANLSAHVAMRALHAGSGVTLEDADVCSRALMEGALAFGGEAWFRALRAYQAATFLRLALVHGLRPRWSDAAAQLVPLARRCLDDLFPVRAT